MNFAWNLGFIKVHIKCFCQNRILHRTIGITVFSVTPFTVFF